MESVTNFSDQESFSGGVVRIDEGKLRGHVDQVMWASVEETLNNLLEAEADHLCNAKRYERTPDRVDTRAGSYERQLHTKAGEVTLKVPRLRTLAFETQIIERYQRRESSVEEALVEMYLAGVSVRWVEDITEALWGSRVSQSTIDRGGEGKPISESLLDMSNTVFTWWHQFRREEITRTTLATYIGRLRPHFERQLELGMECSSKKCAATCRDLYDHRVSL